MKPTRYNEFQINIPITMTPLAKNFTRDNNSFFLNKRKGEVRFHLQLEKNFNSQKVKQRKTRRVETARQDARAILEEQRHTPRRHLFDNAYQDRSPTTRRETRNDENTTAYRHAR